MSLGENIQLAQTICSAQEFPMKRCAEPNGKG